MIQILRPFGYLRIKHPTRLPVWINWLIPFGFSIIGWGFLIFVGASVDIYGSNGLLARLLGFLQSLPGFYIAALAAIATFNNPDMSALMPGTPPTMKVLYNQGWEVVKLTRRRFLSAMFAYLTAVSLLITAALVVGISVAPAIKTFLRPEWLLFVKWGGVWLYAFAFCQLLVVTFWGLFYLGERLHTPDK